MAAPVLPAEIIDIIIDFVFDCPQHPWSTLIKPCANWHAPSKLPSLLQLRFVSRAFNARLITPLYHHITCKGPIRRHRHLNDLSNHRLSAFIRVLRFEIAPRDLNGQTMRVNSAILPADKKLLHYFEVLKIFLKPLLKRFEQVRVLHITSTYEGILEKRIPKNEAMDPCLEGLCKGVKHAKMPQLEELVLGVPYEGGYTNFFEDVDDKKYTRLLGNCGRNLRSASVKLFDSSGNFTTMAFF